MPDLPPARYRLLADRRMLWLGQCIVVTTILALWEVAGSFPASAMWLSSPTRVAAALFRSVGDGILWDHLQVTLTTFVLGYALGAATGCAAGFALGTLPRAEEILRPLVTGLWSLPKVALLPLFIIVFGIGLESKVALVSSVVFFLLLYSTVDGVRDVDPDKVQLLQLMGATKGEILRKIILPTALPWISTGLKISISYAFTTTVVGEMLSSNRGLGYLIESAAAGFDAATIFATVIILVLLSVAATELFGLIESYSHRR